MLDDHIIRLSDAVTVLGDFPALAGINFSVAKGEVVCIEGANGAGKSTLLKLCAGLLPLYAGVGNVLGYDLSDRKQRRRVRRQTGLLAHQTFLYDELSVIGNIKFWARANRSDLANIEPVMERLGLDGRLRSLRVADLSAGQRRRTSLAVMISRRPHIWLLDEPHAALDTAGKNSIDSLITQAVEFGATVVFASHDHARARAVASRVVTLDGGRLPLESMPTETEVGSKKPSGQGFINTKVSREPSPDDDETDIDQATEIEPDSDETASIDAVAEEFQNGESASDGLDSTSVEESEAQE